MWQIPRMVQPVHGFQPASLTDQLAPPTEDDEYIDGSPQFDWGHFRPLEASPADLGERALDSNAMMHPQDHPDARRTGENGESDGRFTLMFHYRQRSADEPGWPYKGWRDGEGPFGRLAGIVRRADPCGPFDAPCCKMGGGRGENRLVTFGEAVDGKGGGGNPLAPGILQHGRRLNWVFETNVPGKVETERDGSEFAGFWDVELTLRRWVHLAFSMDAKVRRCAIRGDAPAALTHQKRALPRTLRAVALRSVLRGLARRSLAAVRSAGSSLVLGRRRAVRCTPSSSSPRLTALLVAD